MIKNKEQLIKNISEKAVDEMDLSTLMEIVFETICKNLNNLTDKELVENIKEFYEEFTNDIEY